MPALVHSHTLSKEPSYSQKIPSNETHTRWKQPNILPKEHYKHSKGHSLYTPKRALHTPKRVLHTHHKGIHKLRRALHTPRRALHTLNRALHTLRRRPHTLKKALHTLKRAQHTLKTQTDTPKSPTYTQKSPTYTLEKMLFSEDLHRTHRPIHSFTMHIDNYKSDNSTRSHLHTLKKRARRTPKKCYLRKICPGLYVISMARRCTLIVAMYIHYTLCVCHIHMGWPRLVGSIKS